MKNAKRFLTVLLCVLMIVPALAACSSTKEPNAAGTEPAGAASSTEPVETAPATTARKDAKDNLPEGLNFNGAEIKIHTRGGQNRNKNVFQKVTSVCIMLIFTNTVYIKISPLSNHFIPFST